ncbi:MAG: hypothetical protein NTW87_03585 [Planctomycetota bacterium]|nr:hypothetical protein [Planctomycetota bacterium]
MAHATHAQAPRGSALFLSLGISLLLAVLVTVMFQAVMTESMSTDSLMLNTQARYLAESAAEYAIRQLKVNIANEYIMTNGTVGAAVLSGSIPHFEPEATGQPPKASAQYKVIRLEMAPGRDFIDPDGVTHKYQKYAVTGRGYVPDPQGTREFGEVYVNKVIDVDFVPLFQYLAFYNRFDLEMLPGNDVTLKGRVHSNYDIYVGAEAGKTLTVNTGYMKSYGRLERHRKDAPTTAGNYYMTGTVQVRKASAKDTAPVNSSNYPAIEARGTLKTPNNTTVPTSVAPSGYDSNFDGYDGNNDGTISGNSDLKSFVDGVQDRWEKTLEVGYNGVPSLEALTDIKAYRAPVHGETPTHRYNTTTKLWEPASGSGATHVPGQFLSAADLVVVGTGTRTKLIMKDGSAEGKVLVDTGSPAVNKLRNASNATINPLSEKTMYDAREGKTVKVTEIDMALLNAAKDVDTGQKIYPTAGAGLTLYGYRTDAYDATGSNPAQPYGIRLTNGATLNNKLTVVSEDPVYVKGNFNTVAGGDKGCAIVADAINLLSNQWNDSKTASSGLPAPTADLEFNAAVMAGAPATTQAQGGTAGQYNGGFENFVRFHEDWTGAGRAVNILGSFVSLFASAYAKGNWVYGSNRYTAPVRNWNFNTKFLNPDYAPPGFLCSIGETRVVWWRGRQMQWWP